jgi:hypothetical protein
MAIFKRILGFIIILAVIASGVTFFTSSRVATARDYGYETFTPELAEQLEETYQQKQALTPVQRKIDSSILQVVQRIQETTGEAGAYEPTRWSTTNVEHISTPIELERSARGNPKLESSLNQLLEMHRREGLPAMQAFAERHMIVMEADRVQVVIEVATPEAIGDLREVVETLGGEYQCNYENLLQA